MAIRELIHEAVNKNPNQTIFDIATLVGKATKSNPTVINSLACQMVIDKHLHYDSWLGKFLLHTSS